MSPHRFAVKITKHEGLKKQVNIAQVKEIMKVINKLMPMSIFYNLIRSLKE